MEKTKTCIKEALILTIVSKSIWFQEAKYFPGFESSRCHGNIRFMLENLS